MEELEQAQSRVAEQATPQRVETSTVLDTPATKVDSNDGDSDEEFIDGMARNRSKPRDANAVVETPTCSKGLKEILPDRQPDSALDSPASPVVPIVPKHQNMDGTQSEQPSIAEAEPFKDRLAIDDIVIPDIRDALAPKFNTGEHHLSDSAIASRAKRIFTPRVDGTKKVSDEIWNDWKAKGKRRQLLQDIFKQCGYDPETCLV